MADHVIDTNVLLVASAADPGSPFSDTHVPVPERKIVFDWLVAFRKNDRRLVLDSLWKIYKEYLKKMTAQDYGLQVVHEKMRAAFRQVEIQCATDGMVMVPAEFNALDSDDRKFLAVALADEGRSTIVNATDPDWFAIEQECDANGIVVDQLIETWLRKEHR